MMIGIGRRNLQEGTFTHTCRNGCAEHLILPQAVALKCRTWICTNKFGHRLAACRRSPREKDIRQTLLGVDMRNGGLRERPFELNHRRSMWGELTQYIKTWQNLELYSFNLQQPWELPIRPKRFHNIHPLGKGYCAKWN